MDWEELKEKATEMGYNDCGSYLEKGRYIFRENGCVLLSKHYLIAVDRNEEQMLMIMRGLE